MGKTLLIYVKLVPSKVRALLIAILLFRKIHMQNREPKCICRARI